MTFDQIENKKFAKKECFVVQIFFRWVELQNLRLNLEICENLRFEFEKVLFKRFISFKIFLNQLIQTAKT